MPERTWKAAFVEVSRAAVRHKVWSGIIAVLVVGTFVTIGVAGSESPAHPASSGEAAADIGGGGVDGAGAVRPAGSPAAAAFSLPELPGYGSGSQITLASYAGKPLIVNFFASWCSPCQQETPLIAKYYRAEHGTIAVVGMDENDVLGNAQSFVRKDGVGYPVAWDPGLTAASAYGVDNLGLPQTFFLNAQHHIVYRVFGPVSEAELHTGTELAASGSA